MDSPVIAHRPSPQAHLAAFRPSLANAGPLQNAFANASQTQTQTRSPTSPRTPSILRLRGAPPSTGRSVSWREDVIDNEGMNKKSSKVCCIYHPPKAVDESSDESSSDSSSDSDSDSDPHRDSEDGARPSAASRRIPHSPRQPTHPHAHDHEEYNHDHASTSTSSRNTASASGATSTTTTTTTADHTGQTLARPRRRPSPNAYEKMPRLTNLAGGMPPQSRC